VVVKNVRAIVVVLHNLAVTFSVTETYGRYAITPTPTLGWQKSNGPSRAIRLLPLVRWLRRRSGRVCKVPFADVGLFKIPMD